MGVALGLAPDAAGNGTTPADLQVIQRSEYATDGLLSGCEISASSSDMSLTIAPGAAVLPTSGTGAVKAAIDSVKLVLDPAPATGTDVYDILVRCENEPGAKAVVRLVKNAPPAPLDKRIGMWVIPAGVTNAAAGYSRNLRDNAVPVGAGLGQPVDFIDKAAFGAQAKRDGYRNWQQTISLRQDRRLQFIITQSFSALEGGPVGSFQWIVRDSVHGLITSPVLSYDGWTKGAPITGSTQQHIYTREFTAGEHTLTWDRQQITGGQPIHVGGQAPQAQGLVWRPYNRLEVIDLGIAY